MDKYGAGNKPTSPHLRTTKCNKTEPLNQASMRRSCTNARPSVPPGVLGRCFLRLCRSFRNRWGWLSLVGISETNNRICLGAFLALDDIELNVIALFQRFISVQLNRGIMDEYIWPVFTPNEAVALGVVEPLDLSLVLSHRYLPSLHPVRCGEQ